MKYSRGFMKIRFDSDDDLPLGKTLNICSMIIVTRSAFQEDSRYYPQLYLRECLFKFVCIDFKNAIIWIWKNWCFRRNWH